LLILLGFILHQTGIVDWRQLLEYIEHFADYWWVWILVLCLKVVFYALAMPGSSLIWVSAILYEPVQSTLLIIFGGVFGGLLGYFFSQSITHRDKIMQKDSVFFGFLKKNSNFFALCAARILPGFPHSVINYGSGILHVPLPRFVMTTLAGFAVKGFVYSYAIHEAMEASGIGDLDNLKTLWPLLVLAALLMVGHLFQWFLTSGRQLGNPGTESFKRKKKDE
jgi:uncharacterized membrane protein YdjX (TVP38/TMEM64 family)